MRYFMHGALLVCLTVLLGVSALLAVDPAKPINEKSVLEKAVKEEVTAFYSKLKSGKAKEATAAFVNADCPISGVDRVKEQKSWRLKPAEYLERFADKPSYIELDSAEIDMVHDGLAVARVKYRSSGIKGYAVITLTADGKSWRIASLFQETYFVW